jgi:hypothetical protein
LHLPKHRTRFQHKLESMPFLSPGIHDVLTPPAIERIRQQDLLRQIRSASQPLFVQRVTEQHRLIMLLIYGDFMRATWYFVFAVVSLAQGTVRTESSFCQSSGFLIQYGKETSGEYERVTLCRF